MGIFSDVSLVMTKELEVKVKEKASQRVMSLLEYADSKIESTENVRYDWENIKWYEDLDDTDCCELHDLLEELDDGGEQYKLYKITELYLWQDFCPLDTWGCYVHEDITPSISIGFDLD